MELETVELSSIDAQGKRKWIYPLFQKGKWWTRRKFFAWFLILFLFVVPWTRMRGNQSILLDFFSGKFHFFGFTLWANESVVALGFIFFFLASILSLTAVFGRVFCGWACPMTVFMEFVFRPIERFFEGIGISQKKFHDQPLSKRLFRTGSKIFIFALISLLIANTMIAYVFGQEKVIQMIVDGPFAHLGAFLGMCFFWGIVFFQFGWFREQICIFVCPYGRLQSLLLDKESLIVGYDKNRGEPRGKPGQVEGDCVDCKLCIKVCPTGIDIRNGLQLECLHCTQCIDACDSIMSKLDRPLGLIRYQTESEIEGMPRRILRPRLLIYSALLFFSLFLMLGFGAARDPIHATIHRESSTQLYSVASDGSIVNTLRVHVRNRSDMVLKISLQAVSPESLVVINPQGELSLKPGEKQTLHFLAKLPQESFVDGKGKLQAKIQVNDGSEHPNILKTQLFGPAGEL